MPAARIYLDHAASTPLAPAAAAAMTEALGRTGNPSSGHAAGRDARDLLEDARDRAARALGCRPRELVFTSGGTEACQLAILGAARARRERSRRVVLSAVEHPAIGQAAPLLAREGFEIVSVPPDGEGRIDPEAFLAAAAPGAAVAALVLVNHETGIVMPAASVAVELRRHGIPLVCDACLGPGRVACRIPDVPADLLAFSAHKFNGPRGVGLLYLRRGTSLAPLWRGGPQEEGLRAGTASLAAAVGLAVALERAVAATESRARRYEELLERFLRALTRRAARWHPVGSSRHRAPGILTLELPGLEGEAVFMNLDLEGVCVATGSRCALGGNDPSATLRAMGYGTSRAASTIRVSVGEEVSEGDAERAGHLLGEVVEGLRSRLQC